MFGTCCQVRVGTTAEGAAAASIVEGKTFTANTRMGDERVENLFAAPLQARFVRIYPTDWSQHVSMRAGVLIDGGELEN